MQSPDFDAASPDRRDPDQVTRPSLDQPPRMNHAQVLVTLLNKAGLHGRPAAMFVRTAKGFKSSIKVIYRDKEADGKSLLGLLRLDAWKNAFLVIEATGEDAPDAVRALRELIRDRFGEPE